MILKSEWAKRCAGVVVLILISFHNLFPRPRREMGFQRDWSLWRGGLEGEQPSSVFLLDHLKRELLK